jgi:hypothetical protein
MVHNSRLPGVYARERWLFFRVLRHFWSAAEKDLTVEVRVYGESFALLRSEQRGRHKLTSETRLFNAILQIKAVKTHVIFLKKLYQSVVIGSDALVLIRQIASDWNLKNE